jgi:glycosyltransferase involved in cell wall biosynthesis
VHVLGVLPPEMLYPALAAADVVALPSLWENFSITALEAMAAGAALVVSAAGGFPEFTRRDEDALVVEPGDVIALGDALGRLLGDEPLRARLRSAAASGVERYRATAIAPRFAAELEALTARAVR